MRTISSDWQSVETARERSPAYLFHIYTRRTGRVTLPDGWGSWTWSVGFQGNVDFTDVNNYAGDGIQSRTYVPAAIEFDASQILRQESTSLDPHSINLVFDPALDPFANYVNRKWPLTFGIVIYKVHRGGNNTIATADDGHGNQIPVVDVIFIGYLDSDNESDTNSAGLEITIAGQPARYKLTTKWDHITKTLDRLLPRPVFSIDCPKILFSTGPAATACNADMGYVQQLGVIAATNGIVVSSPDWGFAANGWFAQGYLVYTATDPVSGLDFTFSLLITASAQRTADGITYGDLFLEMFPPLAAAMIGISAPAYRGCDRLRSTCVTYHIPAGSEPPPDGSFTPGSLRIALVLTNTTTNARYAQITVNGEFSLLSIVYFRDDDNQIGSIIIGTAAWDPTWVAKTSSAIVTSPAYTLASGQGVPTTPGYTVTLANTGNSGPHIVQQPSIRNGYACIIKVSGAGTYDFTISWAANAGQPVNSGNLQNFGGTDIPVEHPSLETTQ